MTHRWPSLSGEPRGPSTSSDGFEVLGHSPEPAPLPQKEQSPFPGKHPRTPSGSSAFPSQQLGQNSRSAPRNKRAFPSQRQQQFLEINKNRYSKGTDAGRTQMVPVRRQGWVFMRKKREGEGTSPSTAGRHCFWCRKGNTAPLILNNVFPLSLKVTVSTSLLSLQTVLSGHSLRSAQSTGGFNMAKV